MVARATWHPAQAFSIKEKRAVRDDGAMAHWFLGFCLGVVVAAWLPALPGPGALAMVLAALLAVGGAAKWCGAFPVDSLKYRCWALALAALGGLGFGVAAGTHRLAAELPSELEGHDLWVQGIVANLVSEQKGGARSVARFEFEVEWTALDVDGLNRTAPRLKRLRLSWYGAPQVQPGQRIRLRVRLKRPHGLLNPAGFDYHSWLFQQGIGATGYVRGESQPHRTRAPLWAVPVARVRAGVDAQLAQVWSQLDQGPALRGLVLGARDQMPPALWSLFAATGTVHLMVISGLHIGLVAAFGFGIGRWGAWLLGRLRVPLAPLRAAVLSAWTLATGYALMAGFSLPVQRAWIVVSLWTLSRTLGRAISPWRTWLLALTLVLVVDPLAPATAGFWLSFGAVSVLLLAFAGRRRSPWRLPDWVRAQGVLFVSVGALLVFWQLPLSWLAPLANLVLVPVFGVVLVPTLLVATALTLAGVPGADLFWQLANGVFGACRWFLEALAKLPVPEAIPANAGPWMAAALALVAPLLMLPRLGALRLAPALLLAVLWWLPLERREDERRLTVFDVGQGLAVLFEAEGRVLLYDAGARYSSGFNTGAAAVVPWLRQRGIQALDVLVISHGDLDHSGGAEAISVYAPVRSLWIGGVELKGLGVDANQVVPCRSGAHWRWGEVSFQVLHPALPDPRQGNNSSCVLRIRTPELSILLPGDIDRVREAALTKRWPDLGKVDILLAPHHGSASSSSGALLDWAQPRWVLVSAGYRNRFGHPADSVLERYADRGIRWHLTARSGAIGYHWKRGQREPRVSEERVRRRRYWFAHPGCVLLGDPGAATTNKEDIKCLN